MKFAVYILLSVTLIQSGLAKPVLSDCVIIPNEKLLFAKQYNGDFEWNTIIVNFHQHIEVCVKINGEPVEQILIQSLDLDNNGVIAENKFDNYPGEAVCMDFASSNNHKNSMIKFIIKGEISKFDYIKICQTKTPYSWPPPTDIPVDTTTVWTVPTWPSTDTTFSWTVPTWPTTPHSWTVPSLPSTTTTIPTNIQTVIPSNWTPPSTIPIAK